MTEQEDHTEYYRGTRTAFKKSGYGTASYQTTHTHYNSNFHPKSKRGSYRWLIIPALPFITSIYTRSYNGTTWPLLIHLIMSQITFFAYMWDKSLAKNNKRRISERTLHMLEVLGGWPGAYVAQKLLKHKSRKESYQLQFRVIMFVHLILWIYGLKGLWRV